ncbi:DUF3231 family protein [Scopulibacillus cellulosilyticus]|uniref:DUF3231 family protein n=1 Tax=Scopulibacillus cellulosilyticus TaxID=2665665 RepID=A0ABW2Q3I1_9BACL
MQRSSQPLSSSEIGTLWLTYLEKTFIMRVLEYFIEKSDDKQAKNIMTDLWHNLKTYVEKIEVTFKNEDIAIPNGFNERDVDRNAPKLFDFGFDIMFVRILKEISMGMYTLHLNMAYREDVVLIYKDLTAITQKCYNSCTQYLLEKGILSRPPNVTHPITNEIVNDTNYLNGFNLFGEKRSLNTIELGYLHHSIETNNIGIQLITGFAQCAKNKEVKDYFVKGKEISKKIIKELEEKMLQSDISFSAASGNFVTNSTKSPFSDKLMMFCIFLLNSFGLGSQSFGAIFSLRNDLTLKMALMAKNIYFYAEDGIKIMIKNGWLDQPPQMADRNKIIRGE